MVVCSVCEKKVKRVKEETAGLFLILFIIPFVALFGLNAGTIISFIMFLSVGLYWLITKPSKKCIYRECAKKRR
jgi:hypothetical protein